MTQDNSIVIREYLTTDKEVVMNLIKLNTPNFFAKEEVNDLSNYLDKEIELYYVLLVDGKVVGCGGINFAEKRNPYCLKENGKMEEIMKLTDTMVNLLQ